jgi:hypothetical protein
LDCLKRVYLEFAYPTLFVDCDVGRAASASYWRRIPNKLYSRDFHVYRLIINVSFFLQCMVSLVSFMAPLPSDDFYQT